MVLREDVERGKEKSGLGGIGAGSQMLHCTSLRNAVRLAMHLIRVFFERVLPPKFMIVMYLTLGLAFAALGHLLDIEVIDAVFVFCMVTLVIHAFNFLFFIGMMMLHGMLFTDRNSERWQKLTWIGVSIYCVLMISASTGVAYLLWSQGKISDPNAMALLLGAWTFFELLIRPTNRTRSEWILRDIVFYSIFALIAFIPFFIIYKGNLAPLTVCLGLGAAFYYWMRYLWIGYNDSIYVQSVHTGQSNSD